MNNKLNKLYSERWSVLSHELGQIIDNIDFIQKPTNPLLIRVNEADYLHSDIKVMIIGQETNDWGHDFNGNVDEVFEIYDDFYNSGYAITSYGGHFWNGFNRFSALLQEKYKGKKISFIWNNVVKIGASGRDQNHPQNHIYEIELNHFKVLEQELDILNPDIILFISGPSYDDNIKELLPEIEFEKFSNDFQPRELAKLKFKSHKNIFRTYHPNYLWRNDINKYFNTIISSVDLDI